MENSGANSLYSFLGVSFGVMALLSLYSNSLAIISASCTVEGGLGKEDRQRGGQCQEKEMFGR